MDVKDPRFKALIADVFERATFVKELGIQLAGVGPGWCETELAVTPRHLQQNGFVHAGVQATLADHTAGGAASTLVKENEYVLTLEFKLNLLRPARGESLRCRAEVLKPGQKFSVVESEVTARQDGKVTLVAKATVTLAVLQAAEA